MIATPYLQLHNLCAFASFGADVATRRDVFTFTRITYGKRKYGACVQYHGNGDVTAKFWLFDTSLERKHFLDYICAQLAKPKAYG